MELEFLIDPVRWICNWYPAGKREEAIGDTPLIAICRAVVRAAFGDEVEDI